MWIIAKVEGYVYAFRGTPTPKEAYALWKSGAAYCGHRMRFVKLVRTQEEVLDWAEANRTVVTLEHPPYGTHLVAPDRGPILGEKG